MTRSTPTAMLLKPSTSISAGRYCSGSISTARRSFTALAYSVRFKRWTGTWPARCVLLLSSRVFSSQPTSASISCCEGWSIAGRRHQAPAQFAHSFLEDLGVPGHGLCVELVEQDVAGANDAIVATEAVGLNGGPLRSGRRRDLVRGLGKDVGVSRKDTDGTRNADKTSSEFHPRLLEDPPLLFVGDGHCRPDLATAAVRALWVDSQPALPSW